MQIKMNTSKPFITSLMRELVRQQTGERRIRWGSCYRFHQERHFKLETNLVNFLVLINIPLAYKIIFLSDKSYLYLCRTRYSCNYANSQNEGLQIIANIKVKQNYNLLDY